MKYEKSYKIPGTKGSILFAKECIRSQDDGCSNRSCNHKLLPADIYVRKQLLTGENCP